MLSTGVALLITQLFFFHLQLCNKQIATCKCAPQDNVKHRDAEQHVIALDNKQKLELHNNNHDAFYKLQMHLRFFPICKSIDLLW